MPSHPPAEEIIVPTLDSVQQFNSHEKDVQLRYYNGFAQYF